MAISWRKLAVWGITIIPWIFTFYKKDRIFDTFFSLSRWIIKISNIIGLEILLLLSRSRPLRPPCPSLSLSSSRRVFSLLFQVDIPYILRFLFLKSPRDRSHGFFRLRILQPIKHQWLCEPVNIDHKNILVQKKLEYLLLTLPVQAHSHPCLNNAISYRNHQKKEHQNVGSHYDTPIFQQISVYILVTRN